MEEKYDYDDDFPNDLDWENRYSTNDYNAMVLHTDFDEIYKQELDDIRDRVGRDQDVAIEMLAQELMHQDGFDGTSLEDMVQLIREHI